jgi:hypothetical protein
MKHGQKDCDRTVNKKCLVSETRTVLVTGYNCCEVRKVSDDCDDNDDDNNNNNDNNNSSNLGTKQVGPRRSDLPRSYSAEFISKFGLATNSLGCGIFLWLPLSLNHSSGIVGYHTINSYYIL